MAAPFRIKIPVSLQRFSLGVLSSSRQTGSHSATRGNQEKEDKESKKVFINHKTWTGSLLKIIKLHYLIINRLMNNHIMNQAYQRIHSLCSFDCFNAACGVDALVMRTHAMLRAALWCWHFLLRIELTLLLHACLWSNIKDKIIQCRDTNLHPSD